MTRPEKVEGLTVDKTRAIAITLIVVGVAFGAFAVIWDLNGGPTWLHAFTWVGGGCVGFGLVTLISSGASAKKSGL
ncbi:hypothetical protein [Herbiconiux sp. UC225_62]|uniref:hypothetical protein n=1 Tax=Herbiconiux sp. UC225_62 TaxID=3350168 RepID=UPI0036D24CA3